ncbi:MAG: ankyrin repeat domain-containing protein [Wolbachia sp.]
MDLKQWERILSTINDDSDLSGNDVVEKIKKKLQEIDLRVYQEWEKKKFDINHRFSQPDKYNMNGFTLLHVAASWCTDEKVVQALLDKGANVNVQDRYWCTPLHEAVLSDKTKIVKVLLAVKGIDVNVQNRGGKTPLHNAVILSNIKVVQALLDKGANVNVQDGYGKTPLYHAKVLSKTKTMKALLKAGADPDIKDFLDKTPRDLAKDENVIKDEENNQIATKAIKTGIAFGVIAGLAIGVGCGVAGVQLSVLAIVGIAVAAALAVGLVAGGITHAVLKPSNKLDELDSNKVAECCSDSVKHYGQDHIFGLFTAL